jgi:hypothetical protein
MSSGIVLDGEHDVIGCPAQTTRLPSPDPLQKKGPAPDEASRSNNQSVDRLEYRALFFMRERVFAQRMEMPREAFLLRISERQVAVSE